MELEWPGINDATGMLGKITIDVAIYFSFSNFITHNDFIHYFFFFLTSSYFYKFNLLNF